MRAIILAGGRGTRLAPYTTVFPKPLMPIGDMPILEIVLWQLKASGITHITLAVGYLAELLKAFFGDGARFGLKIDYSLEEKPLGTVGPLNLIQGLNEPFLMMNGDILTTMPYSKLIDHHRLSGGIMTIATYERDVKVDFGVIETDDSGVLTKYVEKPKLDYRVSMGVYVFQPEVFSYVHAYEKLDVPDLVKMLISERLKVVSFPFSGYWLDIGRPDDYARANEEFDSKRSEFLPKEKL